jgi:Ca-activated chloride channel family protein
LRPQDRVMVVSFDEQVRVDAEFTNERDKLMRAILRTRPGGGTRLVDAMDLSLTERLNKIQGRKAIVIFTDGVDNSSWLTDWQGLAARLEESDVIVYPVRYDTLPEMTTPPPGFNTAGGNNVRITQTFGNSKKDYERAVQNLKDLAANSGGRYHEVATISDTKQAFANIADELRRYYWLGYYPENITRDGRYRKMRVTVSKPEAALRTRAGYRPGRGNESEPGEKVARPALKNTKPE